jgi:hypothetical protein
MTHPQPDATWEFRYLAISSECDLTRQLVTDDFEGWQFVSLCYQSRHGQWFCVFKRLQPTLEGALAA